MTQINWNSLKKNKQCQKMISCQFSRKKQVGHMLRNVNSPQDKGLVTRVRVISIHCIGSWKKG